MNLPDSRKSASTFLHFFENIFSLISLNVYGPSVRFRFPAPDFPENFPTLQRQFSQISNREKGRTADEADLPFEVEAQQRNQSRSSR
jgi:hypothetical protein